MLILHIISVALIFGSVSTASARNFMADVRKKIETVKDNVTKDGRAISFKELFEKEKSNLINTSGGLIAQGHYVFKGPLACDEKKCSLEDVEQIMNCLYWSNQQSFVQYMSSTMQQSQDKAAQLLREKIKEHCGQIKSPLFVFAHELAQEEQQLKDLLNSLLKLSDKSGQPIYQEKSQRLAHLYEYHAQLTQTLQQLTNMANTLLMG